MRRYEVKDKMREKERTKGRWRERNEEREKTPHSLRRRNVRYFNVRRI